MDYETLEKGISLQSAVKKCRENLNKAKQNVTIECVVNGYHFGLPLSADVEAVVKSIVIAHLESELANAQAGFDAL